MPIEQFDDGSLDDLFATLCERFGGTEVDPGRLVTRAQLMELFDAFVKVAVMIQDNSGTPVRTSLELVIRSFTHERLLQHLKDIN